MAVFPGHKPGGEEVNWEEETRHDVIIIGVSHTSDDFSCDDGPPERCSRAPPRIRSRYEEGEVW